MQVADDYYRNLRFVPHRPSDEGAERGLRTCDRIDFQRGVRTAMERIYADKAARAGAAGAGGDVQRALAHEGRTAAAAIAGFWPVGDEYHWELRSAAGRFSWEFRRMRDIVTSPRRAGVGFERPLPTPQHPGRSHHTPHGWVGMLEQQNLDGAVPWGNLYDRSVDAMAVLAPRFQTMPCRTTAEYEERIGYIFLHEVVGHVHGRLRNVREEHAPRTQRPSAADMIAASLERALPGYTTGDVRDVDVPWNWDPDLGTYDPLAS
jgi:hypothetical protein